MKINDKKKVFGIIDNVTENFKNKEIIFTTIVTRKDINCESFIRRIANVCYENKKKVLFVKENSKDKITSEAPHVIEYEYFDELNCQSDMGVNLENTCHESLKQFYVGYDLIVHDTMDIFRFLENKSNKGPFFNEVIIILLVNKKRIFMKDMQKLSSKLTASNINLENFYIFKV
ncbi:hypothetical protein JWS91_002680 [Enterococcus faecalis]|nr:hypothetical protein [Enterococcus faecalis]EHB6499348.1 hypothetical protein [Enterococcus faecalis]